VEHVLLFSYFTDIGEDGLHLAFSRDGMTFRALNGGGSLLAPRVGEECLMRDWCIFPAEDGIFHMVWTTGWGERQIGYAQSPDMLDWSEQREIPVMTHEPTTLNSWAPEIASDPQTGDYVQLRLGHPLHPALIGQLPC